MNSERKKDRILMVMNYLKDRTDDDHSVTIPEILQYLNQNGITTTRKGLYDDFDVLRDQEFEIQKIKHHFYAHIGSTFDLFELNLLTDLVGSTRFLTKKHTQELINKIKELGSRYQRDSLNRLHPYGKYDDRKSELSETLMNLYELHRAIVERKVVSFLYARSSYLVETELVAKKQLIQVEPYQLFLHHDQYYWIGHPVGTDKNEFHYYRLSRVRQLKVLDETTFITRDNLPHPNPGSHFYTGNPITVELETTLSMVDRIYDVFGSDVRYHLSGDQVNVTIPTNDSIGTVNSLLGFGSRIKVTRPKEISDSLEKEAWKIIETYTITKGDQ